MAAPAPPTPPAAPVPPVLGEHAPPPRCFGEGDPLYERYHDEEWARPLALNQDERELLERLSLEAFESGLSWLTILRKRENFRAAFAHFDPALVAAFTEEDIERLMNDSGIVRNRAKILATIANARALLELHAAGEALEPLLAAAVVRGRARPATVGDIPASTEGSARLAKELRARGFRFLGPTTVYSLLQALGYVDDHPLTCPAARSGSAA